MIGFAIAARVRRPEPDSRRSAVNAPNGPLSIARGVRSLLREDSARKTEALGHLREARIALQRVEKRRHLEVRHVARTLVERALQVDERVIDFAESSVDDRD